MQTASRQTRTPCCGGLGFLRQNPDGGFVCSNCNREYSLDDVLRMAGTASSHRPLYGNTYPVKEDLKRLGAFWDPAERVWMVPERRYDEAQEIVNRGPLPGSWDQVFVGGWKTKYGEVSDGSVKKHAWQDKYKRKAYEERTCWECAAPFTEFQAEMDGGVWEQYWCGCLDAPRQKQVRS